MFIVVQEKFGAAWTFVATTFLNELDKNFYEVIILLCIVFCIVFVDFWLIIYFHIAHASRFDHKFYMNGLCLVQSKLRWNLIPTKKHELHMIDFSTSRFIRS